jgi:hypothetical protein
MAFIPPSGMPARVLMELANRFAQRAFPPNSWHTKWQNGQKPGCLAGADTKPYFPHVHQRSSATSHTATVTALNLMRLSYDFFHLVLRRERCVKDYILRSGHSNRWARGGYWNSCRDESTSTIISLANYTNVISWYGISCTCSRSVLPSLL